MTEQATAERLLSTRQLADLWSVHERTIMRHIKSGALEIVRIGRTVRIKESSAARFLANLPSKSPTARETEEQILQYLEATPPP